MTVTRSNMQAEDTGLSELLAFVKDIRAAGAAAPALHYWMPERSGDADTDYQRGKWHFREAVATSRRPGAGMFLAYVLMAMYGRLGRMEHGFLDALTEVAQVGAIPQPLTDEEMCEEAGFLEQERLHESQMAGALASRRWFPDLASVHLYAMLSGVGGEHIGAAITMIARTALNGTRH
ncbi:hypothetical protein [Bradyrhizobium lupini]|uniref:hypothetical protein n=1 Tax=Rhizobium lupini TaxID=136996 RepID=UPI0034C6B51C